MPEIWSETSSLGSSGSICFKSTSGMAGTTTGDGALEAMRCE